MGYALEHVLRYVGCIQSDLVVFKWRTQETMGMQNLPFALSIYEHQEDE